MTLIIVALIGLASAVLVEVMRRQNNRDHQKNYDLLASIDERTFRMDEKIDKHGERITAVEVEVAHLKAPVVTVSTDSAGTTATVEPAKHEEPRG
jgi:hypothetical protein